MNVLSQAVKEALADSENSQKANKAYLEFIKANFIIPVDIKSNDDNPEVLFSQSEGMVLLPVFTEMQLLDQWATEIKDQIKILKLSAVDLLKGIGDEVTVCLDIGAEHYKEFNPSEIARMRSMVLKLFKK